MKRLSLLFAMLFVFSAASAQVTATGAYTFGTFDHHGFDSTNVGNLNVRFAVPIVSRTGRGLPFNYALQYEGLVWSLGADSNNNSVWVPDPSWGFNASLNGSPIAGYLSYRTLSFTCVRPPGWSHNPPPAPRYTGFVYHDSNGANHTFNYTVTEPCVTDLDGDEQITGDGSARDDSGYTLVDMGTVKTRSGTLINPPIQTTSQGNAVLTDANGNQITATGNTFVDTTGVTALTIAGSSPRTFSYPTTTQTNGTVTVYYNTYHIRTNFGCPNVPDYGVNTVMNADLITYILLADGTNYQFTYEGTPGATDGAVTARIASVTLPGGGQIGYAYTGPNNGVMCGDGSPAGLTRTMLSDSPNTAWTYSRSLGSGYSHTNVVDGLGNSSDHDFVAATVQSGAQQPAAFYYETNRNKWNGGTNNPHVVSQATCYNNSGSFCINTAIALPITQVDTFTTMNDSKMNGSTAKYTTDGLQTEADAYDYGQAQNNGSNNRAGLLRKELLAYGACGPSYLLSSDTVQDGVGNTLSQSTYCYDETTPATTSNVPNHVGVSAARGNLTTATTYTNASNTNVTTNTYTDTGTVVTSSSKVNGTAMGTTQYNYDSTFTFLTSTNLPTPSSGVAMTLSAGYDASRSGMPLSSTDVNNQTTSVSGYDAMLRPTEIDYPDGGKTTIARSAIYVSVHEYQSSNSFSDTEAQLDGYGRTSRIALGTDSGQWYQQDTCYDGNGNVAFRPYTYTGNGWSTAKVCSGAGESYTYDVLGRVTSVAHGDGSHTSVSYTYNGRATQTVDENNVTKITQVDGVGRLTNACELTSLPFGGQSPSSCGTDLSGTGFLTSYGYDYAGGGPRTVVTQDVQTRTFASDWVGRPVYTTEPERGTTSYTYGAGVSTRVRPKSNQTGSATTTTTTYSDVLGRPVYIGYDDGLTPGKVYFYDQATAYGQSGMPSLGASKGRLTEQANSPTTSSGFLAYDAMGRVSATGQCLPGTCNASALTDRSYTYDWLGNRTSEMFLPFGSSTWEGITKTYTIANEVKTMSASGTDFSGASKNNGALLSSVQQGPNGATQWLYGNGLTGLASIDLMGRVREFDTCVGTGFSNCPHGSRMDTTGNRVTLIADSIVNPGTTSSLTYDGLNRLSGVNYGNAGVAVNMTYDRFGNRLSQQYTLGSGVNQTFIVDAATNRYPSMYGYDAAGNLTNDGLHSYTYDAEGNVLKVDNGSTATYTYDALNHRVQVVQGSSNLLYGFDIDGHRSATFSGGSSTPPLVSTNAYWGNRLLATYTSSQIYFQHIDPLGTVRVTTGPTGAVTGTFNSMPFGDRYAATGTDVDAQHFAELDHDASSETHNAQFRQYSSAQGRWMSPDPYDGSYDYTDPQSFNRYAYVLNRPLSSLDPKGLATFACNPEDGCYGDENQGGGGGFGAFFNEFTTLYAMFDSWTTKTGNYTAAFYDVPIKGDKLDLLPGYSAGRTFGADGGEIVTPDAYDASKQGCLVSSINQRLASSGVMVDPSRYHLQGGHAEFGLSIIPNEGALTGIGFTFYQSFGHNNGYRDASLFNAVHVNGQGYDLAQITMPVADAQAHFDVGNSKRGFVGFAVHSLVDVFVGTLLGGTSLDPSCH